MTTAWGFDGWGINSNWGADSPGNAAATESVAPILISVDVISSSMIRVVFDRLMAVNSTLLNAANYSVVALNTNNPPVVVTSVNKIPDKSTLMIYQRVHGAKPGQVYTVGVANVMSTRGVAIDATRVSARISFRSTRTDSALNNLPSMYSHEPDSLIGGLLTAISISDDLISGTGFRSTPVVTPITVPVNTAPTASFTTSILNLIATFTDTSTDGDGAIVAWIWDFGDGATSILQNPTHTYTVTGTYLVRLTVQDNGGLQRSTSANVSVASAPNVLPTASFTTSMNLLVLTCTDTSTDSDGTIFSWAWDFGDGGTSTLQNPTHTFSTHGNHTIGLTVTDNDGGVSTQTTHVVYANAAPVAAFSSITTLMSVAFTDASTDDVSISARDWNWGDGTTHGTTQNPTHAYTTNGNKTVTLTVTDSDGATNAVSHTVTPDITKDGPSTAKRTPLSAADFTAIGVTAPSSLYLLQEASGNAADTIGSLTLTTSGSPTYQNAVTSWTRKSINMTQVVSQALTAASGTGPDISTTSFAILAYIKFTGTPGGTRDIMGVAGANGVKVQTAANGFIRLACKGVTVVGLINHNDGNVHPVLMVYDRTNAIVKCYTDLETITGTYSSTTSDSTKGFGATGTTNSPMAYLWGFMASGATAESYGATTITKLGW